MLIDDRHLYRFNSAIVSMQSRCESLCKVVNWRFIATVSLLMLVSHEGRTVRQNSLEGRWGLNIGQSASDMLVSHEGRIVQQYNGQHRTATVCTVQTSTISY